MTGGGGAGPLFCIAVVNGVAVKEGEDVGVVAICSNLERRLETDFCDKLVSTFHDVNTEPIYDLTGGSSSIVPQCRLS